MVRRLSLSLSLAIVILAIVAGCATRKPGRERFDAERAAWTKSRPASYRFSHRLLADGPHAGIVYDVRVVDGRAESVTIVEPADPGPLAPDAGRVTIDQLFDQIEEAYESGADVVTVSFDPVHHHPVHANVDVRRDSIDDEWLIQILRFEPLP